MHIMGMFHHQKDAGRFTPVVDDTTLRCKGRLPWWAGHVQEQGEAFIPGAAAVGGAAVAAGGGAAASAAAGAGRAGAAAAAT